MSNNLEVGDLVTVPPLKVTTRELVETNNPAAVLARRKGTTNWTLQLPRTSVMIVAETPTVLPWAEQSYVTVLHDGMLLEVFLIDIERVDGSCL
jgi:hypothetical protein